MNIGIIGGSGANKVIEALGVTASKDRIHQPDGARTIDAVDYINFRYEDHKVVFISRHGANHNTDPLRLNPTFLVKALEELVGTDGLIIQTSASGCLDPYDKKSDTGTKLVDEGGIVVCDDILRSFGYESHSFSGEGGRDLHAVIDNAYSQQARQLALDAIAKVDGATGYDGGIYVNVSGNQFESPAEVADLFCRLDTPRIRIMELETAFLEHAIALQNIAKLKDGNKAAGDLFKKREEKTRFYEKRIEVYERLAKSLRIDHATVSMNAAKELSLLVEARFKHKVLLSLPVNYGVGLIPGEQVDHKRTENAIENASAPYIAPTLINMIKMATQYIK